ncbi:uncharacterized protein [Miscanthus floridulus]|uniref:uncharacterized protein n=1 Tax=Miscanthus floridulus TaxID=154761 RepID=UPI00345A9001
MPAASPSPFLHTAASAPQQKPEEPFGLTPRPGGRCTTSLSPWNRLAPSSGHLGAARLHCDAATMSRRRAGAPPASPPSTPPQPALRCTDLCTEAEPQHYDRALRPATVLSPPRHSATSPVPRRSSMKPQPPWSRPRRTARQAAASRHLVASPR